MKMIKRLLLAALPLAALHVADGSLRLMAHIFRHGHFSRQSP
jgi:hypothetical protein